jgi:hypothetical protein
VQKAAFAFNFNFAPLFKIELGRQHLGAGSIKPTISDALLDFLENHFLGAWEGHPKGILFNAAHDNSAPFGVNPKLTSLDDPGERDFFAAYFPGPISIGFELYEGFDLLGQVFFFCLVDTGQLVFGTTGDQED